MSAVLDHGADDCDRHDRCAAHSRFSPAHCDVLAVRLDGGGPRRPKRAGQPHRSFLRGGGRRQSRLRAWWAARSGCRRAPRRSPMVRSRTPSTMTTRISRISATLRWRLFPAALAAAEQVNASAAALRDAFLLGAEASCRIGMVLGRAHYQRGFHQTATSGAFGATIAAGRLLGLRPIEMRHALSLVSTRASGLKSQFGTMGKPFNAGIAAANGIEAASLAKRGFVSCDDGLTGVQGFVDTHSDRPGPREPLARPAARAPSSSKTSSTSCMPAAMARMR